MGTKGLGDNQVGLVGVVEVSGIEPLTFWLQTRRSPS